MTDVTAEAEKGKLVRELVSERAAFLAFVRGRVRSHADAEDVLQQALAKAAEHAHELRDPTRARAWFFQLLRRTIADHHARSARHERVGDGRDGEEALAANLDGATHREVAICACILGQLAQIRAEYADILRRVDVEEESIVDAARALGITANNATVRVHRARKALRDQLRAVCGTASLRDCLDCGCDDAAPAGNV